MQNISKKENSHSTGGYGGGPSIKDKFDRSRLSKYEEEFSKNTVGLVSKDEYKRKLKSIYSDTERRAEQDKLSKEEEGKKKKSQETKSKAKAVLSFNDDMEDQEDTHEPKVEKKRNIVKNPAVDTSFLPDTERQKELHNLKLKLSEEFIQKQEKIKEQIFEAKYILWNGLKEVKTIRIRKYTNVGGFIELCKKELDKQYSDMRQITTESLMFVLDDQIIPFGYTFFEMLTSKVENERGRLIDEKEKEDEPGVFIQTSKPGKIVDRRVYEKQKHIFPCNTWRIFDFSNLEE